MTKKTLALLVLAPLSAVVHGQASLTSSGYTQNFDSLTVFGDPDKNNLAGGWVDNSTLQGWYKTHGDYHFDAGYQGDAVFLSTGGVSVQGVYSVGQQFDADRSLGMYTPFTTDDGPNLQVETGLRLTNNTGATVNALQVSFIEEHWTRTLLTAMPLHHQTFSYLVGGSSLSDSGFIADADLDIVSAPKGSPRSVNGNLAANQRLVTATITGISLSAGQDIFMKWTDWNTLFNGSPDTSFSAIDSLSVTAVAAPVPEPATMVTLALGAVALIRRRKAAK